MGKAIFFTKGSLLIKVFVKVLEVIKVGGEIAVFQITVNYFLFLAKHNFFKDSCKTTLYSEMQKPSRCDDVSAENSKDLVLNGQK